MEVVALSQAVPRDRITTLRQGTFHRNLNLVRELALTQFKLKYTGSVLGYLWSLMKPLMMFAVLYAVFARALKLGSSSPHYTLQLLVGIVFWSFFAETVGAGVGVVVGNSGLLKKASFPRLVLVLASSVTSAMTFLINFALILIIAVPLKQMEIGWRTLMVIPLILELYALILGLSLLLSSLFVVYRDLGHIWEISAQALFYGSAILFSLAPAFLGKKASWLALNPIAQIVEDVRHAAVTARVPWTVQFTGGMFAVPLLIVAFTLGIGYFTFRRLTPRFAEYL